MNKRFIKFNCNDTVRVKLTDYGREILRKQYQELLSSFPKIDFEFKLPKEDSEGWSEWQMWHLMQDLGGYMGMGKKQPFELEIQVEMRKQKIEVEV